MFSTFCSGSGRENPGRDDFEGCSGRVRPTEGQWRPPAAFQHSIPHLSEAAISNLYMAGWDYLSPIWDTGKAYAAHHAGTGSSPYRNRTSPCRTAPRPAGPHLALPDSTPPHRNRPPECPNAPWGCLDGPPEIAPAPGAKRCRLRQRCLLPPRFRGKSRDTGMLGWDTGQARATRCASRRSCRKRSAGCGGATRPPHPFRYK